MNGVSLADQLAQLARQVWIPEALEGLAVSRTSSYVLTAALGLLVVWRAFWRLRNSQALPVVRTLMLLWYVSLTAVIFMVSVAMWRVPAPSPFVEALRWILPYEGLAFLLITLVAAVWTVRSYSRHRRTVERTRED